jgi:ParB family chromosome partitioning protein
MDQEQVTLPLPKLHPNPWNRKSFDDQGLLELSSSIKAKGILEPLIVRSLPDGSYEIASGERRSKAAQMAGLTDVPCLVKELTDQDVQEMNLISNIQREDIPALEKAAMVKDLMESSGLTSGQIGKRLGKSDAWVDELVRFLKLPDKVHESVAGLAMNTNQLRAIASLPNTDYKEQIAQELQDGKIKPEQVEHRAHQLHNGFKASMAKRAKKNGAGERGSGGAGVSAGVVSKSSPPSSLVGGPSLCLLMDSPPVAAGNDDKLNTHQLLTALKDDVADNYLPAFGRVGGVMRSTLDKLWAGRSPNAPTTTVKVLKWALALFVVSWLWQPVLRGINCAFTRVMHVQPNQAFAMPPAAPVPSVAPPLSGGDTPQKFTEAMLTIIQPPANLKPELLSGKRIHFRWDPVPGAVGYNFYSAHVWANTYNLENKKPLSKPEGLWHSDTGPDDFKFVATALDGQEHESAYSEPVEVDLR